MTPQEFKEKYIDEYDEVDCSGECSMIEAGTEEVDRKTIYWTNVYMVGEEYFAVDCSKDNTGYYSGWDNHYPIQIRKVVPVIVARTDWVNA